MNLKKRILVAPLNWGLGHATRCIPIINALLENNFEPVLASDGEALELLKKEFPDLKETSLPSYGITYSKNGNFLKLKLIKNAPRILKAIYNEHNVLKSIVKTYRIDGIISDNRLGIYQNNIPSVYISHQMQVLSGKATKLSTILHQKAIKNFDVCWIPDSFNKKNLSGKISRIPKSAIDTFYIGILSRFKKKMASLKYDVMILLSGPEPQRSLLEKKLLKELQMYPGNVLLVRGVIEPIQKISKQNQFTIYNFMQADALELAIQQSKIILSRSGYSTIMDLATLEKIAFFIPTPGQDEQVYLAKRCQKFGIAPYCKQDEFSIDQLNRTEEFNGFKCSRNEIDYSNLFHLFKSE